MENNNTKVITIPLYVIIAIVISIIGIVVLVNKYVRINKGEVFTDIAIIEDNDEITNSRNVQAVSSRDSETSRSELIQDRERISETEEQEEATADEIQIEEQEEAVADEIQIEKQEDNNEDELTTYISVQDITISQDMDLTKRTGVSKEDFVELISRVKADKSKFFYENAETIYDLCEKYELNEIFFCGLISAESGWNIASNHRSTYNYISLMANGKLKQFSSVEEGLEQAAKALHEKYLTPGGKFYHGKTLSGIKTRFCPSSTTWTSLVFGRMKQIYNSK